MKLSNCFSVVREKLSRLYSVETCWRLRRLAEKAGCCLVLVYLALVLVICVFLLVCMF